MNKSYKGRCSMCLIETEVRNIDLYTNGSEGTDLCHNCEMVVVNFINSFSSRIMDARRDVYRRIKKIHKKAEEEAKNAKETTYN